MQWLPTTNALSYNIQISTTPTFITVTDSSTTTNTNYLVPNNKLQALLTYYWRVRAVNTGSAGSWSTVFYFVTSTSGIEQISEGIPKDFKLYNNYPNPFNPSTTIKFDVPRQSNVQINIYNSAGKLVEEIFNGSISPGTFQLRWNADNYSSGIYYLRLNSEKYNNVIKMLYIK